MSGGDLEGWTSPSPRLLTMRLVELAVGGAVVLAVAGAVAAGHGTPALAVTLGVVAVVVAGALLTAQRRYRSWGYLERAEDLLVRRGVLFQRLSVVPYGRMQFVEVSAGLFERTFGLATVQLHTAAARSDARIPGLEPSEAARLRDRLAALGEAKAAGL